MSSPEVVNTDQASTDCSQEDSRSRNNSSASGGSTSEQKIVLHGQVLILDHEPEKLHNYRVMRVAFVQTAMGLQPPSGGFRGNYATLKVLAAHGHETFQFTWAFEAEIALAIAKLEALGMKEQNWIDSGSVKMYNEKLEVVDVRWWHFRDTYGVICICLDAQVMRFAYNCPLQQVDAAAWIETGTQPLRATHYANWISMQLQSFNPSHVMFNDAFASIVTATMEDFATKVGRVEVIHSLEQLPIGPYAGGVSGGSKTAAEMTLWQGCDAVVSVSRAVEKYAKEVCGLDTHMIPNHAWSYKDRETSDWPRVRSNFDKQNVFMVNPAYIKGYEIFLGMAKINQERKEHSSQDPLSENSVRNFIAYASWGSKPEMVEQLEAAGVETHRSQPDMEPVFDNMSVLIVPSLWQEAWGLVATEAQIRGIPVIASNVGGLPEAKRYVGPLIDVVPIDGTKRQKNGEYVIPAQDVKPWMAELDLLLGNRERYEAFSDMSYYTTRQWLLQSDIRGTERLLLDIKK